MSWSRMALGTPSHVKATAAKWAAEQQALDSGSPALEGHQRQVATAAKVVALVCDTLEPNTLVDVTVSGHHIGDALSNSGQIHLTYKAHETDL